MGRPWKPVPLPDGSYSDASAPFCDQDLQNYLVEYPGSSGTRSNYKLVCPPGLMEYLRIAGIDGPVRAGRDVEGNLFIVAGTNAYWVKSDTDVVLIGAIPGRGLVWIAHNQITNGNEVMFSTGPDAWIWNTVEQEFTKVTDEGFRGGRSLDYCNSRFLAIEAQRRFFANSALAAGQDWDALERYEAESCPDRLVALCVAGGTVWTFNERTAEPFQNTTNETDIANHILFTRSGLPIEVGCASSRGVVRVDNGIVFMGSDGCLYELRGFQPTRISTHAIEYEWSKRDLSKCFMDVWEDRGHKVVYITCPDGYTFGYDVATRKFHRRQSKDLTRWRANCLFKWRGDWYAGSYNEPVVYRLDWDYTKEGCDELDSSFTTGVLHDEGNPVALHGVRIEYDSGSEESTCVDVDAVEPFVPPDGMFVSSGDGGLVKTSEDGINWTDQTDGLAGTHLRYCAASPTTVVANDGSGNFYYSRDQGVTWETSISTIAGASFFLAYANDLFVGICWVGSDVSSVYSDDDGETWQAGGAIASGNLIPNAMAASSDTFVFAAGNSNGGIWSSTDGITWVFRLAFEAAGVGYNGSGFLATTTGAYHSVDGETWVAMAGNISALGYAVTGGPGYFVVGTFSGTIHRTTDNGDTWNTVLTAGTAPHLYSATRGGSVVVMGSGGGGSSAQYVSTDAGLTFELISPALADIGLAYAP